MKIFIIESNARTKEDLLYEISSFAEKNKITSSKNRLLKAFVDREKEFSTAFENGIAIPHARIKEISTSAIIIARNKIDLDWKSLDGKKTNCAIALVIEGGTTAANEHMEVLAAVSSSLLELENIKVFKTGTVEKIESLIDKQLVKQKQTSSGESHYDFLAVTSCPTGVAHTNMAAEALEKFARDNNLKIKVERQAAQGTVNPISMDDVSKTNHVILAIGRQIEGTERFSGKKLLKVGVAAPLKDAEKLWKDVQEAPTYVSKTDTKNTTTIYGGAGSSSAADRVSIMAAIMTGLSYMIPIVIVGGIFLAFGLGIGRIVIGSDVSDAANVGTIWNTIFNIGVVGINLAVVVLGGFIAQAIGGRLALAPALIISAATQGVGIANSNLGNPMFFNYETLEFGVKNSNLSFFGAIAAAFLFGYAAKYWTLIVSPKMPKALKTVEPIIIVPILFVLLGWLVFAFFLYLPLYWLSYGLNKGVIALIDNNLMWIAGAIGGAMLCFDLGGPVNKIAFGTGVLFLDKTSENYHPQFMGAIAAAGSVGPVGQATGYLIGAKLFRIEKLRNDDMLKESVIPAYFMGFVGISEGAIPFTIKNIKTAIISNVIGGAVAGGISGAFLITDTAAHTGPIVYLLGAVGKDGLTDYAYGLLYIMAFAVGSMVTALIFAFLELFFDRRAKRAAGIEVEKLDLIQRNKATKIVEKNAKKITKVIEANKVWKGYAWKQHHRIQSNQ